MARATNKDTGVRFHQINFVADHMLKLVKPDAQAILMYAVARLAGKDGQFYLAASKAAEVTGKNKRSAQRAIKALRAGGFITLVGNSRGGLKDDGGGYANTYRIVFDHPDVCQDAYAELMRDCGPAIEANRKQARRRG